MLEFPYEYVRELFDYHKDGHLIWKVRRKKVKLGQKAGGVATKSKKTPNGYFCIRIDGVSYKAHRLIFLWHHGWLPEGAIDHKDTNTLNNKIENLRVATTNQNQGNSNLRLDNKSGYKGASLDASKGKFKSQICQNGKVIHLGYYKTAKEAHDAYYASAIKYFGEFANNGTKLANDV